MPVDMRSFRGAIAVLVLLMATTGEDGVMKVRLCLRDVDA
jgi:hypothetical protein